MIVTTRRIILAIFIAPLIAPVVWTASYAALGVAQRNELIVIFSISVPYAYLIAFFIGLPVYHLFNYLDKINSLTISAGGIVIALVPYVYFTFPMDIESGPIEINYYLVNYFLMAVCGFLVAGGFWLLSGISTQMPHNQNLQRDASPAARRG